MSTLRNDFIVKLKLKGLSKRTVAAYLCVMKEITHYFKKSPLELSEKEITEYLYRHFLTKYVMD